MKIHPHQQPLIHNPLWFPIGRRHTLPGPAASNPTDLRTDGGSNHQMTGGRSLNTQFWCVGVHFACFRGVFGKSPQARPRRFTLRHVRLCSMGCAFSSHSLLVAARRCVVSSQIRRFSLSVDSFYLFYVLRYLTVVVWMYRTDRMAKIWHLELVAKIFENRFIFCLQ